jgi:FkbM family methyltransferase
VITTKKVLRILHKLGILKRFNFDIIKEFEGCEFRIPLIKGLGYELVLLQPDWLDQLIGLFWVKDGGVFIDVGVNLGQTLMRIKGIDKNATYIGFEPNATCCYFVENFIKVNQFPDVSLYHLALFDKTTTLCLEMEYEYDSRASVISGLRPGMLSGHQNVFGIAYDEWLDSGKISLVKIDVEGAELEVILGMGKAINTYRPIVFCEVLDSYSFQTLDFTQERASRLSKLLVEWNYRVIQLIKSDNIQLIHAFNLIDDFHIVEWSHKSDLKNDYLFVPKEKLSIAIAKLNSLCPKL